MHVAFAMTGNRVEKTLRKAGLRKFIGDQWFFPTVEEPPGAVVLRGLGKQFNSPGAFKCLFLSRLVG